MEATYSQEELRAAPIFSYDGKSVVSLAGHDGVHVWDAATGRDRQKPSTLGVRADHLAWLGAYLVTGAADGLVRVWQGPGGRELFTLRGHHGPINALAVGPRGQLASGSEDGTVCVWDLQCGTWVRRFNASP